MRVYLHQMVRLKCLKPSNLATLTWSSPRYKHLPETLFIQSSDGTLSFISTANTYGSYRCEAEEGNYTAVIQSYDVQLVAPPHAMSPNPDGDEDPLPENTDGLYKDFITLARPSSEDPENYTGKDQHDQFTNNSNKDFGSIVNIQLFTPTAEFRTELDNNLQKLTEEKSFYVEMVILAFLLAVCVCLLVLAGFYMWQQQRSRLKPPSVQVMMVKETRRCRAFLLWTAQKIRTSEWWSESADPCPANVSATILCPSVVVLCLLLHVPSGSMVFCETAETHQTIKQSETS